MRGGAPVHGEGDVELGALPLGAPLELRSVLREVPSACPRPAIMWMHSPLPNFGLPLQLELAVTNMDGVGHRRQWPKATSVIMCEWCEFKFEQIEIT